MTFSVSYTPRARRALHEDLPEPVVAACVEFIGGAVAENPHRVGRPLRAPFAGLYAARRGDFRVVYRIDESAVVVVVITIQHRRAVYHA